MRYFLLLCLIVLMAGCKPDVYIPKPRGYFEIPLPKHEYQHFNGTGFPYAFDFPVYGKIVQDTVMGGIKPENPYWINIDFPTLGGRLYISYKKIDAQHPFDKLLDDSHELSYTAHGKKADYINTPSFDNGHGAMGIFYTVGGNTATRYSFFATDSVQHYMRASLYFIDAAPNADSLAPVNDFLKKDMEKMIETLRWK